MLKMYCAAFVVTLLASTGAMAQGTKERPFSSNQPTSAPPPTTDAMGGSFRGTGTPTFGTSPGMGSDQARGARK